MKIKMAVITLAGSICLFSACSGDKSTRVSKDTGDRYGVKPSDTSNKADTGKVSSSDNSGSGGTKIDSPRKPK